MIIFLKKIITKLGLKKVFLKILHIYAIIFPCQIIIRDGIKYKVDLQQVIDLGIFMGGWESDTVEFLRKEIKPNFTVLEIGSNVGAHTLLIAKIVGSQGRVHAFEPTNFALSKLKFNISLNPDLKNISICDCIVTNKLKSAPNLNINSSWKLSGKQSPLKAITNPTIITIDEYVDINKITKVDLIKIDTDGYDYKVLQGAFETIKLFKPIIYCELCEYTLREQGDSLSDIFEYLSVLGYLPYYSNKVRINGLEEVLNKVGNNTSINGLFIYDNNV